MKAFFIFQKTETQKKYHILKETELSSISENKNQKKFLIFQEATF